uniref:Uncharacterized protein n=1 Tax=Caenorhabditis japonica TaxID=281687 RepID=A0A8R1I6H7_CAEJA
MYFIVGRESKSNIDEEMDKFGDILQTDVVENYHNISYKKRKDFSTATTTTTRRLKNGHLETGHFETASTGEVKSGIRARFFEEL